MIAAKRYYRKVIKIRAEDSPNVQLGLRQFADGLEPTNEFVIPGVKGYAEYVKQRRLLSEPEQCVILDAEFYEGRGARLYPSPWLDRAERNQLTVVRRGDRCMGVDTAEGGDSTVWVVVDEAGVIELVSEKTPDTVVIVDRTLRLMSQWGVKALNVLFDRGGGGKQHVDWLRDKGYGVRTVAFGEKPSPIDRFRRYLRSVGDRVEDDENRTIYRDRRAEMYGILRDLLNPANHQSFAIPAGLTELRRQLSPIPLWYDEGKLYLPPKHRKPDSTLNGQQRTTMMDLIGCSPDEADALVLAVFAMTEKGAKQVAGAIQ